MAKKIALITGAGSGIGNALCEELLSKGWKIYGVDKVTDGLIRLQEQYGLDLCVREGDVRDSSFIAEIIREVESTKNTFDFWINCAGVSGIGEFLQLSKEDFDKTLEINLLSVVDLTRMALKHMGKRGKGTICNISSVAGFVSAPLMSAYCLTKHALVGFSRSLQAELEMSGSPLKILLVCPGFVDTSILEKGKSVGFPKWLSPILSKPKSVAQDIVAAFESGQKEVVPTLNGKIMLQANKWAPWALGRGRRLLMARSVSDLFLNRY
jgi:short-subunit dehydrogenase